MTRNRKLTISLIDNLTPGPQAYIEWDAQQTGFGVRVYPSGVKAYIYQARDGRTRSARTVRKTLGKTTAIPLADARKIVARYQSQRAEGVSLKVERRLEPLAMNALFDRFLADHVDQNLKPSTRAEYHRIVRLHLRPAFGARPVPDVGIEEVQVFYARARARWKRQARYAIQVLSKVFALAEEWQMKNRGSNPCSGWRRPAAKVIHRPPLTGDEWQAITTELDSGRHHPVSVRAIKLLRETGCRAGEICNLEWRFVDEARSQIVLPDSKTGPVNKSLSSRARLLLADASRDTPFVCPSPRDPGRPIRRDVVHACWRRVLKNARVAPARLHDIRHWFATRLYTDPSTPLAVAMKAVGHTQTQTADLYTHLRADAALEAVERIFASD